MAEEKEEIALMIEKKIDESESYLFKCRTHPLVKIDGVKKLMRKLEAELNFLKKLRDNKDNLLDAHVDSSNLVHLGAIVHAASSMRGVVSILKPFRLVRNDTEANPAYKDIDKVAVDVVTDCGHTWIKVVARNPQSMDYISTGQGHYGEKSILEHAKVYLSCAQQNMYFFTVPTVQFVFYNGINDTLHQKLSTLGIVVKFPEQTSDLSCIETEPLTEISDRISKLNLDVSTMMAYVSSLTNGGTEFIFQEKILTEHAEMEKKNPIKIYLDRIFKGSYHQTTTSSMRNSHKRFSRNFGQSWRRR
ncbi:hypothetical protein CHUAL_009097 [Chamberlinius hualienensis]